MHHAPGVEEKPRRDDAKALRRDEDGRRGRRVKRPTSVPRDRHEDEADDAEKRHVVDAREKDRPHSPIPPFFAPRFWPTSVAAAFDMPQDGRSAKMTMRIAIVYPATAARPKLEEDPHESDPARRADERLDDRRSGKPQQARASSTDRGAGAPRANREVRGVPRASVAELNADGDAAARRRRDGCPVTPSARERSRGRR